MNKKILLIQPTLYLDNGTLEKKRKLYFVGLAYPLIAAMTPSDWTVEICLECVEEIPWNTDADVIGVGGMGHAANRGKDIARQFKALGKTVLMGGPMASLAPELVEAHCHAVLIGDIEEYWPQVLADLEQGTLQTRYYQALTRLETPLPRYELLLDKPIGDFLPVQAGRGCPNSCSFCSIHCLYRTRYFQRNINHVIRDIEKVRSLGFHKFLLLDDNILSDRQYMLDLCRRIAPLGMTWYSQCEITLADDDELLAAVAHSGCRMLSFGLESISPAALAVLDKSWCNPARYRDMIRKITDAGIEVASEMIVGVDTDTRESLRQTIDWVASTRIATPKFYIMTPIPGTDLHSKMQAENRILNPDPCTYTASKAVFRHPNLQPSELEELFWEIYDSLYTWPRILRRTILQGRALSKPTQMLFLLGVNMYYKWQINRRIAPIIL